MPDELYFIVCLRHNNMLNGNEFLLLWGPDRNGYTTNISEAGIYTKEEIEG